MKIVKGELLLEEADVASDAAPLSFSVALPFAMLGADFGLTVGSWLAAGRLRRSEWTSVMPSGVLGSLPGLLPGVSDDCCDAGLTRAGVRLGWRPADALSTPVGMRLQVA